MVGQKKTELQDRIRGILLGTAVGDSLGLPAEGMKPQRIKALNWNHWHQRLIFRQGMWSDDTEHTWFVAQSLIKHAGNSEAFQQSMAWKLVLWLLGVPAGIGFGTLRAILKLAIGFPPEHSGVNSAGNGPAMRSAIIGGRFHDDPEKLREFVRASTIITHRDPRALIGALAVAVAVAETVKLSREEPPDPKILMIKFRALPESEDKEWEEMLNWIKSSMASEVSVAEFAAGIGLGNGVTGYVYHTVPVALFAWLRHYGNFRDTVTSVLNLGGDTDTTGAIAGALAGASCGASRIPRDWITHIREMPRDCWRLRQIANAITGQIQGNPAKCVKYFYPLIVIRNLIFVIIVLIHGFFRILPTSLVRWVVK